jgi:4-amino-4-deoxy-L-arabinose transferase-like glycosyltransferase
MWKKNKLIIGIVFFAAILRLVLLNQFPAGLNADEASLGYNAWSLIQTGKDEHGASWPLVFRSFDDYKPPLYVYLALPFIKILGLSVTAVRLPSALLGVVSVYFLYLLVNRFFPKEKIRLGKLELTAGHLAAFILSISPWHLHFSRGAWEVNIATFFMIFSIIYLHKSFENTKNLYIFSFAAVLSLYTYHSARIITPLLIVSFSLIFFGEVKSFFQKKNLKITISAFLLTVIFSLPIVFQMLSVEGQSRFSGVSIFADSGPVWQATNFRIEHKNDNLPVKLIHNKYFSYSMRFLQNYLSHYSFDFQFIDGDVIARSRVPEVGQNLLVFFPFFAMGILYLIKLNSLGGKFVLSWFLIAPIPAALTYQSPHALRAENMAIPLAVIVALGLVWFINFLHIYIKRFAPFVVVLVSFTIIYSFSRYLHMYYVHYPKELPFAWQYGFDQIAEYTKENYNQYDKIIISDRYDQPYILIAFFSQFPPDKLQEQIVMSPPDQYGFSTGRKLDKYEFRSIKYEEDKNLPNTLLISAEEKVDDSKVINTVKSLSGEVLFKFISTK